MYMMMIVSLQPMYNTIGKKFYLFLSLVFLSVYGNLFKWSDAMTPLVLTFAAIAALVLYGISKVKGTFGSILIGLMNIVLIVLILGLAAFASSLSDI